MSLRIMKKEVKELLTLSMIIPVLLMSIIFGAFGGMIGSFGEEATKKPVIGLINQDDGIFSETANSILNSRAEVIYDGSSIEEGLQKVEKEDGIALLVIPPDFSDNILGNKKGVLEIYWIMRGAGIMDSISPGVVEGIVNTINQDISKSLIEQNVSINSTVVLNPTIKNEITIFKGIELKSLSPSTISNMISSQSIIIPLIILMLMIMTGNIVISSMGMEKENKTLETLLTLPVKRSSIVIGKITGSAIVGLIMALIYMFGFGYYMQSFQIGSNLNLASYGLSLGLQDYILVGISLFITLFAGLSLFMVLGTFAKDYKSAQTLTFPVTALVIFPTLVLMFKDFDTLPIFLKMVVFAIPFSHPMMALRNLMFGDYLIVLGGILYTLIFAAVTIAIVDWIFKTDRILTGRIGIKRKRFKW